MALTNLRELLTQYEIVAAADAYSENSFFPVVATSEDGAAAMCLTTPRRMAIPLNQFPSEAVVQRSIAVAIEGVLLASQDDARAIRIESVGLKDAADKLVSLFPVQCLLVHSANLVSLATTGSHRVYATEALTRRDLLIGLGHPQDVGRIPTHPTKGTGILAHGPGIVAVSVNEWKQ
jgi:hypothetical protein